MRRPLIQQMQQRLPPQTFRWLKQRKVAWVRFWVRFWIRLGWNLQRTGDYYSVLPVVTELARTRQRWERASELVGIDYDLEEFWRWYAPLPGIWQAERDSLPSLEALQRARYGEGYPRGDAFVHYALLRHRKPRRLIEVGSGLSTRISWLAAERNRAEGHPLALQCIEPYPYPALRQMPDITLQVAPVQDVPSAFFQQLGPGDVLFIDSTHTFKLDSDVAYLFLEVLPRLQPGVLIHVHDVVLPYTYPYPAEVAIFQRDWPYFWNEALALQALLCGSKLFRLRLCMSLMRHHDPQRFALAQPGPEVANEYCAVWLEKIA